MNKLYGNSLIWLAYSAMWIKMQHSHWLLVRAMLPLKGHNGLNYSLSNTDFFFFLFFNYLTPAYLLENYFVKFYSIMKLRESLKTCDINRSLRASISIWWQFRYVLFWNSDNLMINSQLGDIGFIWYSKLQ